MKKLIFSALSIALLAGGISSCAKSTKGKVSNDWKVDSYEVKTVDTDENGDQTITTTTMSGNTVVKRTENVSSGSSTTTTQSGTLNSATFKIEKDGTWTMQRDYSYTMTPSPGVTVTKNTVETESGTWSFVGKNKEEDFKKNERVLFNTLSSTSTTTSVTTLGSSSTTTTTSDTDTYMTGENTMIYTVTESKSKELKLSSEAGHTFSSGSNSTNNKTTTTISLVEE